MIVLVVLAVLVVGSSAQNGQCPAPNGDFPNPSSEVCTTFFRCILGRPTLLRCPANQRFDFLFRICRPQGQVNCNRQLQVFTAPSVPGLGALGGLGGALGGGAGGLNPAGGLGAAGGLTGALGGLGAGLPNGGLITLLAGLGGGDGDGDGGAGTNSLTLLALNSLLRQRAAQRQQPVGGAAAVNPFSAPFTPAVLPPAVQSPIFSGQSNLGTVPANARTIIVVPQNGQTSGFVQTNQFRGNAQLQPGVNPGQGQVFVQGQPGVQGTNGVVLIQGNTPTQGQGQGQLQNLVLSESEDAGEGENV